MLLSAIVLFTVGCQEEENVNPIAMKTTVINNKTNGNSIKLRKLYWTSGHEGATPACHDDIPGNCFPDIVVEPSVASAVADVFTAVSIADQVTVQAAFQANYVSLNTMISTELIDGVINGLFTVTAANNSLTNTQFLLFHRDGIVTNDPYAAVPFK